MSEPVDPDTRGPRLANPVVTRAKFSEQLRRWRLQEAVYRQRGWILLDEGELSVEVGFLRNVPVAGQMLTVMTTCVRLDYWNFDLWPPSVTFLDPITRMPIAPVVRAPDRVSETEVRDALIDGHPKTGLPFLCLPGIREYHQHPQHSGDDWLLHRHLHEGDLAVICERIWRRMSRNVLGVSVVVQSLGFANQLEMNLLQGDADLAERQMRAQAGEAADHATAQPPGARPAPGPEPLEETLVIAESTGAESSAAVGTGTEQAPFSAGAADASAAAAGTGDASTPDATDPEIETDDSPDASVEPSPEVSAAAIADVGPETTPEATPEGTAMANR